MKKFKLYSTIDCQVNGISILSSLATKYKKNILDAIDQFDKGSRDRGLMDYIYNDALNEKIQFAEARVEIIGEELFGVLICTLHKVLTDNEIELLKEECVGLYADGWGEGFEQVDIKIPNSKDILNVSFFYKYGSTFYKGNSYNEVETQEELEKLLSSQEEIQFVAFQNIDFTSVRYDISNKHFNHCFFLGCKLSTQVLANIGDECHIYQQTKLPFNPFLNSLYTKEELFGAYEPGIPISYGDTLDKKIYNHYLINGKEASDIKETLFRRLHDHSITDAMHDFLKKYNEKQRIAVMGGHNLKRGSKDYIEVAKISKELTELGYLMLSGGGPGAMEATHLGAWLAGKSENDLNGSIKILSEAPDYKDELWLDKAFEVLRHHPNSKYESLGIPTWLYGHEPPTPFASKIAKYFANSVREDGLLAIAKGGIVFAPGSAGTIQEVFQDAAQNNYLSFGFASPMIFFNTEYWNENIPIYPLIEKMIEEGKYKNMIISAYDSKEKVIEEIQRFT